MKNAENSSDFAFVLISGPPNWEVDAERTVTQIICGFAVLINVNLLIETVTRVSVTKILQFWKLDARGFRLSYLLSQTDHSSSGGGSAKSRL